MGTLHGAVLCVIGDAAIGMAYASVLPEDEIFTNLDMNMHLLRPVWQGEIVAHGRVVSRGRTVGPVQCDVPDANGRLVARLTGTRMALRDGAVHGR